MGTNVKVVAHDQLHEGDILDIHVHASHAPCDMGEHLHRQLRPVRNLNAIDQETSSKTVRGRRLRDAARDQHQADNSKGKKVGGLTSSVRAPRATTGNRELVPKSKFAATTTSNHLHDDDRRLASNACHFYDPEEAGDPFIPTGIDARVQGRPWGISSRSTASSRKWSGDDTSALAVAIILSGITMYNYAVGAVESSDFGHYDRLVERNIITKMFGASLHEGTLPHQTLKNLLPDSGARFLGPARSSCSSPNESQAKRRREC